MTYPFVPAGSYRTGRARTIRLICVHSTESPCAGYAPRIANYFAGGPGVSSHYVVDDTQTIQCVRDEDTAFTAPNANADGLHIEQCGRAGWSRTEWLTGAPAQMLETQVAPLLAHLAAKHGIPLRWLTPAQVAAGERGLCQHNDVTQAYPGTGSHWDCGPSYPADRVLELATGAPLAPAAPPTETVRIDPMELDVRRHPADHPEAGQPVLAPPGYGHPWPVVYYDAQVRKGARVSVHARSDRFGPFNASTATGGAGSLREASWGNPAWFEADGDGLLTLVVPANCLPETVQVVLM